VRTTTVLPKSWCSWWLSAKSTVSSPRAIDCHNGVEDAVSDGVKPRIRDSGTPTTRSRSPAILSEPRSSGATTWTPGRRRSRSSCRRTAAWSRRTTASGGVRRRSGGTDRLTGAAALLGTGATPDVSLLASGCAGELAPDGEGADGFGAATAGGAGSAA
jgi:hypothetical protein